MPPTSKDDMFQRTQSCPDEGTAEKSCEEASKSSKGCRKCRRAVCVGVCRYPAVVVLEKFATYEAPDKGYEDMFRRTQSCPEEGAGAAAKEGASRKIYQKASRPRCDKCGQAVCVGVGVCRYPNNQTNVDIFRRQPSAVEIQSKSDGDDLAGAFQRTASSSSNSTVHRTSSAWQPV